MVILGVCATFHVYLFVRNDKTYTLFQLMNGRNHYIFRIGNPKSVDVVLIVVEAIYHFCNMLSQ